MKRTLLLILSLLGLSLLVFGQSQSSDLPSYLSIDVGPAIPINVYERHRGIGSLHPDEFKYTISPTVNLGLSYEKALLKGLGWRVKLQLAPNEKINGSTKFLSSPSDYMRSCQHSSDYYDFGDVLQDMFNSFFGPPPSIPRMTMDEAGLSYSDLRPFLMEYSPHERTCNDGSYLTFTEEGTQTSTSLIIGPSFFHESKRVRFALYPEIGLLFVAKNLNTKMSYRYTHDRKLDSSYRVYPNPASSYSYEVTHEYSDYSTTQTGTTMHSSHLAFLYGIGGEVSAKFSGIMLGYVFEWNGSSNIGEEVEFDLPHHFDVIKDEMVAEPTTIRMSRQRQRQVFNFSARLTIPL